jgi:predicted  nucleic acid-binding Zn-ribbon protein
LREDGMEEQMTRLIELSEIDGLRAETREQLERYPAMLAEMDKAETRLKGQVEKISLALEAALLERRNIEKKILQLREKIHHFLGQQSSVKTNKEYEALTHEIERSSALIDALETEGLEKLDEEEQARARLAESRAKLATLTEENAADRERVRQRMAEKRESLERLERERADLLPRVPASMIEDYELVDRKHPGSACVPIDGSTCGGCGWELTAHVRQAAARGEIPRCESCRRFLYDRGAAHRA